MKIENIKYNYSFTKDSLTYSIDMLHIEFISNIGNKNNDNKNVDFIIKYVFMLLNSCGVDIKAFKNGEVGTFIKNIEPNLAKRKYCNYRTLISYDGITLLIGRFLNRIGDTDVYDCECCVRLIYNPNKHINNEFLELLVPYLSNNFTGRIIKYDLAIDVPNIEPNFVNVFTRKQKSTCKDTQYYGARSRHGYIKIYNKSKELKLKDTQITRIEFTLKSGQALPTDEVYIPILNSSIDCDFSELPDTAQRYVLLINEIKNCGGDWKKHYDNFNFRMRKKIEPFVVGGNKKLILDYDVIIKLLKYYTDLFSITQRFDNVNENIEEFEFDLGF